MWNAISLIQDLNAVSISYDDNDYTTGNGGHLERVLQKNASFELEISNQCFFLIVIISASRTCNLFFSFLFQ